MSQTDQQPTRLSLGFVAELKIGDRPLQVNLLRMGESSLYAGVITLDPDMATLNIQSLVGAIDQELSGSVPGDWGITINKGLLVYGTEEGAGTDASGNPRSKGLLGIDLSSKISLSLSDLPFVGDQFPADLSLGLDRVRILATTEMFSERAVESLKAEEEINNFVGDIKSDLPKGVCLAPTLRFADVEQTMFLPLTDGRQPTDKTASKEVAATKPPAKDQEKDGQVASAEEPVTPTAGDLVKWFKVQKRLGPVAFNQVGLQYEQARLWLLLDMAIVASKLTLSLDGLSVGFKVQKLFRLDPAGLEPEFRLLGIGIDYKSGGVRVSGALQRKIINGQEEYSGVAIIKTSAITLSAIGSYTRINGEPSLFVYAFLAKPIGGPSFFFVTGLAAGFGYNRSLIMPATLDEVETFPLVRIATGGSRSKKVGLLEVLNDLQPYIPPSSGDVFLAIGVRFTSFKLIDSFVLLVASFGDRFQLKLMGISTIIAPPATRGTPVAKVQIALRADIDPEAGCLKIDGKILPGSYILSKQAELSGGFAFYSWFSGEHEGDFVLTVGGYHPRFRIPAHYPRVERFGLNWQVDSNLNIKGEAYFALTSAAIMAGGVLEANWREGDLRAWFHASAHFLVSWKPYFYDIEIGVEIGASYTLDIDLGFLGSITETFSVSLGAHVHIWGPEFSGEAEISWYIISFSVSFGGSAARLPPPLRWQEFRDSFLPKNDVCSIGVNDGLIRVLGEGDDERWVLNGKEFALVINSAVPATHSMEIMGGNRIGPPLGIASMHIKPASEAFNSSHNIVIKKKDEDGNWQSLDDETFTFKPILKGVPSGLWGELGADKRPDLNGKVIAGALSGYEILPGKRPEPSDTADIACRDLGFNRDNFDPGYHWEQFGGFLPVVQEVDIRDSLNNDETSESREALIKELGGLFLDQFDELTMDGTVVDDFLSAPQIDAFT